MTYFLISGGQKNCGEMKTPAESVPRAIGRAGCSIFGESDVVFLEDPFEVKIPLSAFVIFRGGRRPTC